MLEGNSNDFARLPPIKIGGVIGAPIAGEDRLDALQHPRGAEAPSDRGASSDLGPSLAETSPFQDLHAPNWRECDSDSRQNSSTDDSALHCGQDACRGYDPRATLSDFSQEHAHDQIHTGSSQQIGLLHRAARGVLHALNDMAVFTSERIFTSNSLGRVVCASSAALGWLAPPEVYRAYPSLALVVAAGALVTAIAASAVNRAIAYEPELMQDPIIAKDIQRSGRENYRESLCIAGLVMGPMSFWAGISPLLTHLREASVQALESSSDSTWASVGLNYAAGRVEHMVPFMLIGMLTTMRLVNKNPERFVHSMSRMASLLHRYFGGIAHVRESLSRELRDE